MDYQLNQSQDVEQDRMSLWYVFLLPPAFFYFSLLLVGRIMPFIIVPQSPGAARDMALGNAMGVISYALLDIFLSIAFFIFLLRKRNSIQSSYVMRKHKMFLIVFIVGIVVLQSWLFLEEASKFIANNRDIEDRVASIKDRSNGILPCMDYTIIRRFNLWSECIQRTLSADADYQRCLVSRPSRPSVIWSIFGPSDGVEVEKIDSMDVKSVCDKARSENQANGLYDSSLAVSSCFNRTWPSDNLELGQLERCLSRFLVDTESLNQCVAAVSEMYFRTVSKSSVYSLMFVQDICKRKYDSFMKYESSGH